MSITTIGRMQIEMMANVMRLQRDMDQAKRVVGETAIKMAHDMEAMRQSVEKSMGGIVPEIAALRQSIESVKPALDLVTVGVLGVSAALSSLPRSAFDYSKELETTALGMAGIMGSVASLNGKQLQYNQALGISQDMMRKLGDDALRTAASSQELTSTYQALLAPGLAAGMKLEEIRKLTVVGTNAVKSMGLSGHQVVQELRDLVAGGITASSSALATSLGLTDADIAKAKASSEGLFNFLMKRLLGFEAASEEFGKTIAGRLDALKEGAIRATAAGMMPLTAAISAAVGQMSDLLVTFDQAGNAQINPQLVNSLSGVSESMVSIMNAGKAAASAIWDNREAVTMLAAGWAAVKVGGIASDLTAATQATIARAQASRLAAIEAAAEGAATQTVALTAREKTAALLSELQAQASLMQSNSALAATEVARLTATQEGIIAARAQSVATLQATRSVMAQAEAQLSAAKAAGAQSFALAMAREAMDTLSASQARHAALTNELAMLGRQQASVHTNMTAAMAAQTVASEAAEAASTRLSAATNAASISATAASAAGRAMGAVMGALGGPVGIAVTSVTLLIAKLVSLQSESENAAKVAQSLARINDASRAGAKPEDRDLTRLQAQLSQLKEQRDELLIAQQGGGLLATLFPNDYAVGVANDLRNVSRQITETEGTLDRSKAVTDALAASTGNLTLTLSGLKQAWQKSIDGIKTASSIQEDYKDKLDASRRAYEPYLQQLKAAGAAESDISAVKLQQAQSEHSLLKQRDDALKHLNGTRAVSVKLADTELASLKAKLDAEQKYGELLAISGLKAKEWTEGQKQAAKLAYEVAQGDAVAARSKDAHAKAQWTLTRAALENRRVVAEALGQQQASNSVQEEALKALNQQADHAAKAATALEAENEAWGKSKTAIEAAALATLQLKKAGLTGTETQAYRDELDRAIKAQQRWVEALGQADYKKQSQAIEEWNRSATEQASLYQDALQLSGMTALEQAKITAQRSVQLKLVKQIAEIERSTYSEDSILDWMKKQELIQSAREAASIESSAAVSKVLQEDWKKSVEKYDDIFRQGFANMLNGGQGSWNAFTKSLSSTFKTTVADEIYRTFARPFVVQLVANLAGITGLSTMAGAANAATGGGTALGAAGNAASLYNASTSLGSAWAVGSQWYAGSMSGANAAGTLAANATGTGIDGLLATNGAYGTASQTATAAAYGPYASALGGALVGFMAGKMISGGYSVIGESGNVAVVAGTAIGMAVGGPIGAAIGGAIGGVVNRAFGMGAKEITSGGISGTFSAESGASVRQYSDWEQDGGWFSSDRSGTTYSEASGELSQYLNQAVQGVTAANRAYAASLGLSTNAVAGYSQAVKISLQGLDEAGQQKAIEAALTKFGAAMVDSAWGSALEAYHRTGEASVQTLTRLSTSLTSVNQAFDTLGQKVYATSLASADMAQQLADLFGGLDKLQSATASYYQAYYSEAERTATTTRQVTASLAALGYALPATREGFRALVEAQDLTTASGRTVYAALIGVQGAFASITKSSDELAATLKSAMDSAAQALASLVNPLLSAISQAQSGVASARGSIAGATTMTARQIQDAIASASISLPDASGVTSARTAVDSAYQKVGQFDRLDAMESAYAPMYQTAAKAFVDSMASSSWLSLQEKINLSVMSSVQPNGAAMTQEQLLQRQVGYLNGLDRYGANFNLASSDNVAASNYAGGFYMPSTQPYAQQVWGAFDYVNQTLRPLRDSLGSRSTAEADLSTAQAGLVSAQTAYSQAMREYVADAGKAVERLNSLRDATVAYYQQQKALADTLLGSATKLRGAVDSVRLGQLDAVSSLAQKQRDFDRYYSLGLATSGTTQAGYADQMTAALPDLVSALKDTAASRTDWALSVAQLAAKSSAIASSLEASVPVDYQAESLGLLDTIDGTLSAIQTATSSAEKVISDAIYATSADNLTGLRAIVTQLGGTPGFASGGYTGSGGRHEAAGIVHRGEVVWSQEDVARVGGVQAAEALRQGRLQGYAEGGVVAAPAVPVWRFPAMPAGGQSGGSSSEEALLAEIRALRQEVEELRIEARATAVNTSKAARILERVTPDGQSVQMVVAE